MLPGRTPRRIYVTAHYDTLNLPDQTAKVARPSPLAGFDAQAQPGQDYEVKAPGANDDGSGTVLVMELARRFAGSGIEFDATLVFALWSGEEQGEFGSLAHAQRMAAAKTPIDALFNNDIVGNSRGGDGSVDGSTRKQNWLRLENTCRYETMVLQRYEWHRLSHSIRRAPFGFLVLLFSRCGT